MSVSALLSSQSPKPLLVGRSQERHVERRSLIRVDDQLFSVDLHDLRRAFQVKGILTLDQYMTHAGVFLHGVLLVNAARSVGVGGDEFTVAKLGPRHVVIGLVCLLDRARVNRLGQLLGWFDLIQVRVRADVVSRVFLQGLLPIAGY